MTRETKVGLLVGLAFIVLFGIIITEKSGTIESTEPESSDRTTSRLPQATSSRQILPRAEFSSPTVRERNESGETAVAEVPGEQILEPPLVDSSSLVPVIPTTERDASAAQRRSEGGDNSQVTYYTVKPGDTLIGIARKVYGPDHAELYKHIFNANRDVLESEDAMLWIGMKLKIPRIPDFSSMASLAFGIPDADETSSIDSLLSAGTLVETTDAPILPSGAAIEPQISEYVIYTVRAGDTLSEISQMHLGTSRKWQLIYDLNKGSIKTPAQLRPGTQIKIPVVHRE